MGYKLFLEVEKFLKNQNWCRYKSNSDILNILNRYQDNLEEHLNNAGVLALIAQKTKAGSLVKLTIRNSGNATLLSMSVVGENGSDILFKEEKEITSDTENAISITAIEWLNAYSKTIPYDGRVIKAVADQITINVGERYGMALGQYLKIYRPIGKKKHPLLEEIINWEKREYGKAEIIEVRAQESVAEMREFLSSEAPMIDDWALMEGKAKETIKAPLAKKEQRARYGYISLAFDIGSGSQTTDIYNFQNQFDGIMYGARLKGEVWFTENWWAGVDLAGRVGNLESNNAYILEDNETRGYFKIKGGYRFLPTGFFSGPQIDLFVGWGAYFYQPEYVEFYGPIDANFWGVLLGVKGTIPIGKYFRGSILVDFLISTAKDKKGGPGYFLELMFNYLFRPYLTFDASISGWGNSWDDIAPNTDIRYKDFSLLLGATYYF
ncbi:MAG: hypothetical protein E2O68_02925 [Deltaproteobacteria bacterium]|nr:MAG: hypothetical protein E2O68_02925 [Deltaproteobacteria bacterium]